MLLPKSLQTVDAANLVWNEPLGGHISGVFIWNRCLTDEEIHILSTGSTWRRPWGVLPGKWHHIAASFKEGTSKSRAHRSIYVNGVQVPANKPCKVAIGKDYDEIRIGSEVNGPNGKTD